jgi:undecaprenyl-diphosphatase
MGAVLFYGFLAYLAYVLIPDRRRRLMAVALLAPLPILIGVSRIYVGGHWFSDVIGGWIVGLFFLVGFAEAYRLLAGREVAPPATTTPAPIEP